MTRNTSKPTSDAPTLSSSEVRPERRSFTAAYKLRVLAEADACTDPGAVGTLLRREGLYSSHLSKWRVQREEGALAGLSRKRGRPPQHSPEELEVNRLER